MHRSRVDVSAAILLLSLTSYSYAQELPAPRLQQNPSTGANLIGFLSSKTPYEFWLACMIGIFGVAIIFALISTLRRVNNVRPEDIARPIIVVTVITGTLILITVGYSNEQVAPAFGLFGTIVGYMLGRLSQSPTANVPPDQQQITTTNPKDATNPAAGPAVAGPAKE